MACRGASSNNLSTLPIRGISSRCWFCYPLLIVRTYSHHLSGIVASISGWKILDINDIGRSIE